MESPFERYSITFGVNKEKVEIFKAIIRFLDYLSQKYNMGFRIFYAKRMNKK